VAPPIGHLSAPVSSTAFPDRPCGSYYNTGSCVHPLSITGIEITFDNGPQLRLVEWGQAIEGNRLLIIRDVLAV
jgi:hypothetical protein